MNTPSSPFPPSLSGATSIGVGVKHQYELVSKDIGRGCGIYKSYSEDRPPQQYTGPLLLHRNLHKGIDNLFKTNNHSEFIKSNTFQLLIWYQYFKFHPKPITVI